MGFTTVQKVLIGAITLLWGGFRTFLGASSTNDVFELAGYAVGSFIGAAVLAAILIYLASVIVRKSSHSIRSLRAN